MTPHNKDLQELRKFGYHVLADEVAESLQRWDDGLEWRRASPGERYLSGDLRLQLHLKIGVDGAGGVSEDYLVEFQLAPDIVHEWKPVALSNVPVLRDPESEPLF